MDKKNRVNYLAEKIIIITARIIENEKGLLSICKSGFEALKHFMSILYKLELISRDRLLPNNRWRLPVRNYRITCIHVCMYV